MATFNLFFAYILADLQQRLSSLQTSARTSDSRIQNAEEKSTTLQSALDLERQQMAELQSQLITIEGRFQVANQRIDG